MDIHGKRVLFLSHTTAGGTFRVGSHHLSREFAMMGCSVAHVTTPVSYLEKSLGARMRGRFNVSKLETFTPEVRRLIKNSPAVDHFGVVHDIPITRMPIRWSSSRRGLKSRLERIGFGKPDVTFVDDVLLRGAIPDSGIRIYRPTDTHTDPWARALSRQVLKSSDAVVAASRHILNSLPPEATTMPHLVLENGVEDQFFGNRTQKVAPHFVYVGAVDYRFDWEFVLAAATQLPTAHITIAGPIATPPPTMPPTNLRIVGEVDYADVPGLLATATVGLLPTNSAPTNLGRSPMKFYEYLASELYVVAASTPSLRDRVEAPGTYLYGTVAEGIAQLKALLDRSAPNLAGSEFARQYSWGARARLLRGFVESLVR